MRDLPSTMGSEQAPQLARDDHARDMITHTLKRRGCEASSGMSVVFRSSVPAPHYLSESLTGRERALHSQWDRLSDGLL